MIRISKTLLRRKLLKLQPVVLYGLLLAVLVFVLKWLQWKFLITDLSLEIYIGIIAVFFTVLGVWVAIQLTKNATGPAALKGDPVSKVELDRLGLTGREYEVLRLLSQGQPNAEIAANLFLSISTVKTHVSNLFVKMDVKNRAQAVDKANRLKLVP